MSPDEGERSIRGGEIKRYQANFSFLETGVLFDASNISFYSSLSVGVYEIEIEIEHRSGSNALLIGCDLGTLLNLRGIL